MGTGGTLFFVLSGFLITRILLVYKNKSEEEGLPKNTFIKKFYIRRGLYYYILYFSPKSIWYKSRRDIILLKHTPCKELKGTETVFTGQQ